MTLKPTLTIMSGVTWGSAWCSCGYSSMRSVDTSSLLSARSKVNSVLEAIASSSCHVMQYWYLRENGGRSEAVLSEPVLQDLRMILAEAAGMLFGELERRDVQYPPVVLCDSDRLHFVKRTKDIFDVPGLRIERIGTEGPGVETHPPLSHGVIVLIIPNSMEFAESVLCGLYWRCGRRTKEISAISELRYQVVERRVRAFECTAMAACRMRQRTLSQ